MTTPHQDPSGTPSRGPHGTRRILPPPSASESHLAELARLLDRYLEDLQAGRAPDRAGLIAAHPDLAPQLAEALDGLDFLHGPGLAGMTSGSGSALPSQLGDFRIVREVGRGGMGVVYEAEQLSLKRRVALKVLRAGAVVDEVAMQRFQREAETIARLHHTNIVPIHAVGAAEGVRYYAMEFIEGRDLADVLAAEREGKEVVTADAVARWGLQAAEALAHAHARGVVHRDIKPSNLLLDTEGRLWLTDFGLARRQDDVTLSLTGALLGTPRYMSPEQARAASLSLIDHRTDLYSLGATLYELATRRPIFDAATTHEVLSLILNQEPLAPRALVPDLPRDLETIILKCLAKEPERRYATAQALAEDLRAFIERRPIRARRPGWPERTARWARHHRRSLVVGTLSASISMLILGGALVAGGLWRQAQQPRLTLTTRQPMLEAELLHPDRDETVVPAFSLPTRQPVAIPPGSWRLRVSAPGQPSETLLLDAGRFERLEFELGLAERALGEPLPVEPGATADLVELDAGGADYVVIRPREIRRIDAATGREEWRADMTAAPQPALPGREQARAAWERFFQRDSQNGPRLLRPTRDLDGDGTNDLVWAGGVSPGLLAVSGQSGRVLWWVPGGAAADARAASARESVTEFQGGAVAEPVAADLDGDGTEDVVAQFVSGSRRWVTAVSGRTGAVLWRRGLDAATFRNPGWSGRADLAGARLARVEGRFLVVTPAATRWLVLDGAAGGVLFSNDLAGVVIQTPRVADLDGDGAEDVLWMVERGSYQRVVQAWSLTGRRMLWEKPVDATFDPSALWPAEVDWPTVADLDRDGRAEVLLPARTAGSPAEVGATDQYWAGLTAWDGRDGSERWTRALARGRTSSVMTQADRFLVGPDLDGDGVDDLAVVTLHRRSFRDGDSDLHVDAVSGRDGQSLWTWNTPLRDMNDRVGRPVWWPVSAAEKGVVGAARKGGLPRLVFPVIRWPAQPEATYVLDGANGRFLHLLPGAFDPDVADVDGDGLIDLELRRSDQMDVRFGHARHRVRGTPAVAWSRLMASGRTRVAAPDLNGDGLGDLLVGSPLQAYSGADGTILWQSKSGGHEPLPLDVEGGDLDGDGVRDLVAVASHTPGPDMSPFAPISAISGRTGRTLWTAPVKTLAAGQLAYAGAHDLDADRVPEIVLAVELRPEERGRLQSWSTTLSNQLWLVVLSSRDGTERWRQPMSGLRQGGRSGWDLPLVVMDLDRDGVRDLLGGALGTNSLWELRAWQGRDGRVMWSHALTALDPGSGLDLQVDRAPRPAAGDLDGDGFPEVAVIDMGRRRVPGPAGGLFEATLRVMEGRTGQARWTNVWEEYTNLRAPAPVFRGRAGQRGGSLVVLHRTGRDSGLVAHGPAGEILERRKTDARELEQPLWTVDVDGDGTEELAWVTTARELMVARADVASAVAWATAEGLVAAWPGARGEPTILVVRRAGGLEGLAGTDARALWRLEDTFSRDGRLTLLRAEALGAARLVRPGQWSGSEMPSTPGTIECRAGVLLAGAGAGAGAGRGGGAAGGGAAVGPGPGAMGSAAVAASAGLSGTRGKVDERMARALPWDLLEGGFGPQAVNDGWRVVTRRAVLEGPIVGLMLLAPWLGVVWAWRKWAWRGAVPAVFVAVFWCLLIILGPDLRASGYPSWWQHAGSLLLTSALGAPQLMFLHRLLEDLTSGRWRGAGRALLLALGLAVAAGTAWLMVDLRRRGAGEFYAWDGGPWILLVGGYLVGVGATFAAIAKRVWPRGRGTSVDASVNP